MTTRDAHARLLEQGETAGVRTIVADSWLRSVAAGIEADASDPPITLDRGDLRQYRAEHPLAPVFPLLSDVLGQAVQECDAMMAVADEHGQLLWVCGSAGVLRRAESISFVEGAQWDEAHAGTNAPGTALRLDAPVTIRAAEHFVRPVQAWSCAAAPIHDLATGRIIGVVDVTGGDDIASTQTSAMVRAAARMAEAELGRIAALQAARDAAGGPSLAAGLTSGLYLQGLGRPDILLSTGGRSVRLSLRHSEILTLLATHREGLAGDELAVLVYPGDVSPATLRAEIVRLRSLLGADVLASRPYRLRCEVTSDWAAVAARLAAGDVAAALRLYPGPLLPSSDAPEVARVREDLHDWLRAMVLADGGQELVVNWTQSRWGAGDLEMWRRQCALLPSRSPLRPRAEATVERLDTELGR
ncbi:MAG TPA: GAF domain-containing protein [Trebonia sp.]|nr:GAF domain-containing protein [Trebonia sp.]